MSLPASFVVKLWLDTQSRARAALEEVMDDLLEDLLSESGGGAPTSPAGEGRIKS